MEISNLNDFIGGWFIGNFEPSLYKTNDVEVSVKSYKLGDKEDFHFHKIATEFTVIITGKVKMGNQVLSQGDIITIKPLQSTNFEALTDSITLVVKIPGANNDKYLNNVQ